MYSYMFMKDHIERLYAKCKQVRGVWLKVFRHFSFSVLATPGASQMLGCHWAPAPAM